LFSHSFDLSPFAVELAVNNVGVGGCKPLNPGAAEMWSFFDHGFLPGMNPRLSTFLMIAKTG
jgi:hypothetical protein